MACYVLLPSDFGTLSIVWRVGKGGPRVLRIYLPRAATSGLDLTLKSFPDADRRSSPTIAALARRMAAFLQGQSVSFDLSILALERCTRFQLRVLRAEFQIPRGYVSTYGRIARHLGQPKSARAVGGALSRNPFPIVVPCHRAIRADGRLGGFQGGWEMKRALLELEGVPVLATGRVLTERFYY